MPSNASSRRRGFIKIDRPMLARLGLATVIGVALAIAGRELGPSALAPLLILYAWMFVDGIVREKAERRRWRVPTRRLAEQAALLAEGRRSLDLPDVAEPELRALRRALEALRDRALTDAALRHSSAMPSLTRSGLFEPPSDASGDFDAQSSAQFGVADMVGRLEPEGLRWLASSPAEQEFLGCSIEDLRQLSFLDLVHSEDRPLAEQQLRAALEKGEAHGLIYRIRTPRGEPKAVEVNVGVRYAPDGSVSHLRCHLTDVTERLRARREQRRRTRELERLNEELRRTNHALAELKDRYSDLYQNAPAMYFSLDGTGRILVCNDTLLRTLGYQRSELVGRPYVELLPEDLRPAFPGRFRRFVEVGSIEVESRWVRADGVVLDVLVKGTAVRDASGRLLRSRSVAQDVTPLKRLASELEENNRRLARANGELSSKNKELDEFSYVVSHDLQEPLRTLIAFSDFLRQDCAEGLGPEGLEYLQHLTDASRRMRALIRDLLGLSRAGRAADEFRPVELGPVLDTLRADLAELIRSRGAELRVAGDLPAVWGDRARIGQLFANLIGNGLKYNQSERPEVEVGARPDDDPGWITLYVRDNGIGIDPQFHAKIFQIFRRLHPREQYEGTGAGLAICQKIVQAHGGRIWVESRLGQGATFCLTLPRPPAPAIGQAEATADETQEPSHAP